jgi:hypothetical protein
VKVWKKFSIMRFFIWWNLVRNTVARFSKSTWTTYFFFIWECESGGMIERKGKTLWYTFLFGGRWFCWIRQVKSTWSIGKCVFSRRPWHCSIFGECESCFPSESLNGLFRSHWFSFREWVFVNVIWIKATIDANRIATPRRSLFPRDLASNPFKSNAWSDLNSNPGSSVWGKPFFEDFRS